MGSESGKPGEYRQSRFRTPPGATEILLVRHGESEPAHPDRLFPLVDGQGDPGLALEGREQAERVGLRLGPERIDAIYVSTLRAARRMSAEERWDVIPGAEPAAAFSTAAALPA
ncbi:histidine phosphatase family protein [Nonomuraea diastatica]|uniref:Histidine phosphatase family protein n=1 Tax=Nonomuraea diastatica TaxID=1848329 RepID=A0A4R4X4W9_9ACTN|nr:histidine phosphatase family protein [Nonomuraea diastatica]TDD25342.1 hypothetical protein E1294_03460 [Nonomuraea diastatica]